MTEQQTRAEQTKVSAGAADGWADGEQREVTVQGASVVVVRYEGEFYALKNQCSHKNVPLLGGGVEGGKITCEKHGAKFELATGKARALPAVKPVPIFRTSIEGGEVWVSGV